MGDGYSETIAIVLVALGSVTNILLLCALAHTWKHWRQVRWYVVLLTGANIVEVAFTVGLHLGWLETETWSGTREACKFLVFMSTLGPCLANMALAGMGVHVLLTSITGNQGSRLRHALVIGLFVLLSLPMPIAQIALYDVETYDVGAGEPVSVCGNFMMASATQRLYYEIGFRVAVTFFPLTIVIVTCAVTLALNRKRAGGKTDVSTSDLVLAALLGLIVAVCCVPADWYFLYLSFTPVFHASVYVIARDLTFLFFARPILSAAICVVFGYVHAFWNRGEGYAPVGGVENSEQGEKQRLVN